MINKESILKELKDRARSNLAQTKEALTHAKEHATEDEMKSEGKYDTRSIEAGYLASAFQGRKEELEQELALLDEIDLDLLGSDISVGSLVEIELNSQKRLYFISSGTGGTLIEIEKQTILIISAFSPIGAAAIGLQKGDSFELEVSSGVRDYQIINVW